MFLSPYSAYSGVLSNFLARFSRLALRILRLVCLFFFLVAQFLSFPVFLLCELIRNCKTLRITVQLQPHKFDFALKTRVANYLLTRLHIYKPTWSPLAMPSHVPAVRYTEALHSSMRTSLSSAGVSWRTLMGYPNYARNRACELPSPWPFHWVIVKIVPVVQLAAHAKSAPWTVVRSYVQIFRLDGLTTSY